LLCQRFVGRVLLAPGIDSVVITPATTEATTPTIELRFDATLYSQRRILEGFASYLDIAPSGDSVMEVSPALTARDRRGAARYYRYGQRATGWKVVSERIGMIK